MAQFHQRFAQTMRARQSISAYLYGPALVATVVVAASSPTRLEAQEERTTAATPGMEFVGVFVDKESASKLRAQYPAKFTSASASEDQLFLVLKYNPTEKEKETFAPILGRTAQLHVKGSVQDDRTQALLVAVTTEMGDPIDFETAGGEFPHVTLSSFNGEQGLNSGYTSVLLERLRGSGQLQWLLENEAVAAEKIEWSGELPSFDSALLPLFNPFPAVTASVTPAQNDATEATVVTGTICVSSSFDPETGKCVGAPAKAECGFCKFMKAGPCGKEFSAWEACLDKCKQSGSDFIEHCGLETLALRDCVDANPEYYSVLNEAPEGEGEEDKVEEKEEEAQEKQ